MAEKDAVQIKDKDIPPVVGDAIQKEHARRMVEAKERRWRMARLTKESTWLRAIKNYRAQLSERQYEGRARIFDPELFKAIEALAPRVVLTLASNDPPFKLRGREGVDQEQADLMQAHLEYQWDVKINGWVKLVDFVRYQLLLGWSVAKTPFRHERKQVKLSKKFEVPVFDEFGREKEVKVKWGIMDDEKVYYDDPDFIMVNHANFLADPKAGGIDYKNPDGVVEIIDDITFDHLKRQERTKDNPNGIYSNIDKLKNLGGNARSTEKHTSDNLKQNILAVSGIKQDLAGSERSEYEDEKFQLVEYWGPFDFGKGTQEAVITLARTQAGGNSEVIRCQPNPFYDQERPYVYCPNIPLIDDFYSIGHGEMVERQQYQLNDLTNQDLDVRTFMLMNQWIVPDTLEGWQLQQFRFAAPNKVYRVPSPTSEVVPVRPPDFTNNSLQMILALKNSMRETLGATNPIQGFSSRSDTTATEIQANLTGGNMRILFLVRLLEENVMKTFIRRAYRYNLQFKSTTDYVNVIGPDGEQISVSVPPEKIYGDYDFIVRGASDLTERQLMLRKLLDFFGLAGNYDIKRPGMIDMLKILEKIWSDGFGFPRKEFPKGQGDMMANALGQGLNPFGMAQGANPLMDATGGAVGPVSASPTPNAESLGALNGNSL